MRTFFRLDSFPQLGLSLLAEWGLWDGGRLSDRATNIFFYRMGGVCVAI